MSIQGFNFRTVWLLLSGIFVISCASTVQVTRQETLEADYSQYQLVGPKKRIFITEFSNRSAYGQRRLGQGISDVLATELAKTNLFLLLEREKLTVLLDEQSLAETGIISEQTAPAYGKLLGANAVITGSVTQFGVRTETHDIILTSGKKQIATCAVDLRIVDVNTGSITWAGSGQGEAVRSYTAILGSGKAGGYDEALEGEAFRAAIVSVMENMVVALNSMPWFCTVAKVSGDKIYINAGRKSNLNVGTELVFYEVGEAIVDPTTGLEIGREETRIGTGEVISHFGEDGAVVTLTEGAAPVVGGICRVL